MDESVQRNFTELDQASRELLAAADYIERHGWCQHQLWHPSGRVCMVGAILAAQGRYFSDCFEGEAWRRLQSALNNEAGRWNDAPGRTKEEAIAKLREVAMGGR